VFKNLKVGDVFKFGSYEQDNNTGNGKEEIEWVVLQIAEPIPGRTRNRVKLISKYILDCQPINDAVDYNITWETCKLRAWLNSTFLNSAFTPEEQSSIFLADIFPDRNPENYSDPNLDPGNNDTQDRLFLLSMVDVEKYFKSYEERRCAGTPYAKSKGLWVAEYDMTTAGERASEWWTRTPAYALFENEGFGAPPGKRKGMAIVGSDGIMPVYGGDVTDLYIGVRPVMWLEFKD
jgi:hypothetical protein